MTDKIDYLLIGLMQRPDKGTTVEVMYSGQPDGELYDYLTLAWADICPGKADPQKVIDQLLWGDAVKLGEDKLVLFRRVPIIAPEMFDRRTIQSEMRYILFWKSCKEYRYTDEYGKSVYREPLPDDVFRYDAFKVLEEAKKKAEWLRLHYGKEALYVVTDVADHFRSVPV